MRLRNRHCLMEYTTAPLTHIEQQDDIVDLVLRNNAAIEAHLHKVSGRQFKLRKILPVYENLSETPFDGVRFLWRVQGFEQPGDPTFRLDLNLIVSNEWEDEERSKWCWVAHSAFVLDRRVIKKWKSPKDEETETGTGVLNIARFKAERVFNSKVTSGIKKYIAQIGHQSEFDFSAPPKLRNTKKINVAKVPVTKKPGRKNPPKETRNPRIGGPSSFVNRKVIWDVDSAGEPNKIRKFKNAAKKIIESAPSSSVRIKCEVFEEGITISATDKKIGSWTFDITEKIMKKPYKDFYELLMHSRNKQYDKMVSNDKVGMTKAVVWFRSKIDQLMEK